MNYFYDNLPKDIQYYIYEIRLKNAIKSCLNIINIKRSAILDIILSLKLEEKNENSSYYNPLKINTSILINKLKKYRFKYYDKMYVRMCLCLAEKGLAIYITSYNYLKNKTMTVNFIKTANACDLLNKELNDLKLPKTNIFKWKNLLQIK